MADVRYASNSDHSRHECELTLSAINDHRSHCKGFDRTHIHCTHVPLEEPSTASIADISHIRWHARFVRRTDVRLAASVHANQIASTIPAAR
jgi:hypothetical protein